MASPTRPVTEIPQPGQMVRVRNRSAIVRDVYAYQDPGGQRAASQVVEVEYVDNWDHPATDRVIWHLERDARVLEHAALPRVVAARPEAPTRLDAFLNAYRWEAVNRLTASREEDEAAVRLISPWQSAVQIEDYQLYPVLKALLMPRVGLLLADDVGLGKTIEAGLILAELIARRRVRRVLIVCPAALQGQWRAEMSEKFYLDFEIIDRDSTFRLRKAQGIDTNPWSSFPRVITSMDYLRQPTVRNEFMGACEQMARGQASTLPWNLLIVDEAHNLAPATYGDDSQRCETLRLIAPRTEHRLFLSATPHNGYTLSFTGLLEMLDPIHFHQDTHIGAMETRIHMGMVRRLKSELNVPGAPPRFPARTVEQLNIALDPREIALYDALRGYRQALLSMVGQRGADRLIADFLVTILTKRLLSSAYAFARTWWQHVDQVEEPDEATLRASVARAQQDVADDQVRQQREEDVARLGGSWVERHASRARADRAAVTAALEQLGWMRATMPDLGTEAAIDCPLPPDAKVDALLAWIQKRLREGSRWRADERAVIFTEYKDTLDYLRWRLRRAGYDAPQIAAIFGGADDRLREQIKAEFTDPASLVRVLVGTDAVSEGINLQTSCRYIVHADIPWNPMRMEQRNGRVDRHGQARDVFCWHFHSDDEADLRFLSHVARKIATARQDLGSVGSVIDAAILERFTSAQGQVDAGELDRRLAGLTDERADRVDLRQRDAGSPAAYRAAMSRLEATELDLRLTPVEVAQLLREALALDGGRLEPVEDAPGVYRLRVVPPTWQALIRETLASRDGTSRDALPKLVFDPAYFQQRIGGRAIYQTRRDTVLLRLGHPVMRRALGTLRRQLWEGTGKLARWTILEAPLTPTKDLIVVASVLIEATNELRETLHQEVRDLPFEALGGALLPLDPALWERIRAQPAQPLADDAVRPALGRIRPLWDAHEEHLLAAIQTVARTMRTELTDLARRRLAAESAEQRQIFADRLAEARKLGSSQERDRMVREADRQRHLLATQPRLFPEVQLEEERRVKEIDWQLAASHQQQMGNLIAAEQRRILEEVLPRRYALAASAPTVRPLTVTYWVRRA